MSDKAITSNEELGSKVAKLLPAEVTALYLSLRPFFEGSPLTQLIVAIICLILSIAFIRTARKVTSWNHVIVYTLTFGIWVLTIEPNGVAYWMIDVFHINGIDRGQYSNIVAIISTLWTFLLTFLSPALVASDATTT
jgi:hypothetical protein